MANYNTPKNTARINARIANAAKPKGKSLDAFREEHDASYLVPKRIKAGLVELGDSWEYEGEFIRRVAISVAQWGAYKAGFADHIITTLGKSNKRVVAGTVKFARALAERMQ